MCAISVSLLNEVVVIVLKICCLNSGDSEFPALIIV